MGYLRITGGQLRGRKIVAPAGQTVRPMQGFLREAIFSVLGNLIHGSVILDCFAGTGSIGLEALSRGADQGWFLEKSRQIIPILRQNIVRCGVESQAIIIQGDWLRGQASNRLPPKVDVAFFDPPYAIDHDRVLRGIIQQSSRFQEALLVYRLPDQLDPFQRVPGLEVLERRRYGENGVVLCRMKQSGNPSGQEEGIT